MLFNRLYTIQEIRPLPPSSAIVYMYLMDKSLEAWLKGVEDLGIQIGVRELCDRLNISDSAVQGAMKALSAEKLIEVEKGAGTRRSTYRVTDCVAIFTTLSTTQATTLSTTQAAYNNNKNNNLINVSGLPPHLSFFQAAYFIEQIQEEGTVKTEELARAVVADFLRKNASKHTEQGKAEQHFWNWLAKLKPDYIEGLRVKSRKAKVKDLRETWRDILALVGKQIMGAKCMAFVPVEYTGDALIVNPRTIEAHAAFEDSDELHLFMAAMREVLGKDTRLEYQLRVEKAAQRHAENKHAAPPLRPDKVISQEGHEVKPLTLEQSARLREIEEETERMRIEIAARLG